MNINDIIDFLAELSVDGMDNPNLVNVIQVENIALPLAFASQFGYATLTDKGIEALTATYDFFAEVANERGLDNIYDLIYTDTPVIPRRITITIPEV